MLALHQTTGWLYEVSIHPNTGVGFGAQVLEVLPVREACVGLRWRMHVVSSHAKGDLLFISGTGQDLMIINLSGHRAATDSQITVIALKQRGVLCEAPVVASVYAYFQVQTLLYAYDLQNQRILLEYDLGAAASVRVADGRVVAIATTKTAALIVRLSDGSVSGRQTIPLPPSLKPCVGESGAYWLSADTLLIGTRRRALQWVQVSTETASKKSQLVTDGEVVVRISSWL